MQIYGKYMNIPNNRPVLMKFNAWKPEKKAFVLKCRIFIETGARNKCLVP
jgi:hypothetical protein